ncbi:hypothetical protein WYO_1820 [Methylobacterium sp. GXF4]|nr:hypothetical protein WYO_1820 [Methylobacterium sp. GXF4]
MVNGNPVVGVELNRIVFDRFSGYRTKPGQTWWLPVWRFAVRDGRLVSYRLRARSGSGFCPSGRIS